MALSKWTTGGSLQNKKSKTEVANSREAALWHMLSGTIKPMNSGTTRIIL